MKNLSIGSNLAWQIAAMAAGAAKFQFIKAEQSGKIVLLLYILYLNL